MLEIVNKITASNANRLIIPIMLLFKRKQTRTGEEEGIYKSRSVLIHSAKEEGGRSFTLRVI